MNWQIQLDKRKFPNIRDTLYVSPSSDERSEEVLNGDQNEEVQENVKVNYGDRDFFKRLRTRGIKNTPPPLP